MIRLNIIDKQVGTNSEGKRILKVSLDADTAAEVRAIGTSTASVDGLASDTVLAPFSDAFTADKQLLILNSSGVWE